MRRVFADAFYFVALLNRADQYHSRAAAIAGQLHGDIVTTQWVLTEVADALSDPANRRAVSSFIRDLEHDPKVTILGEGRNWFELGLQLYERRPDKDWPLTDCISFAVMREQDISDALTGDRHFAQAGFKPLLG